MLSACRILLSIKRSRCWASQVHANILPLFGFTGWCRQGATDARTPALRVKAHLEEPLGSHPLKNTALRVHLSASSMIQWAVAGLVEGLPGWDHAHLCEHNILEICFVIQGNSSGKQATHGARLRLLGGRSQVALLTKSTSLFTATVVSNIRSTWKWRPINSSESGFISLSPATEQSSCLIVIRVWSPLVRQCAKHSVHIFASVCSLISCLTGLRHKQHNTIWWLRFNG